MSEKRGNFFEAHIEKMVFAIIGIMCLWLLITRVLISPNYVEFDDKKFSSGEIDTYIVKEADSLKYKIEQPPESKPAPKSCVGDFLAKLNLAAGSIDGNVYPPQPAFLGDVVIHGKYRIPSVDQVDDVSAEHIRAVAYIPSGVVDEEHEYGKANSEPNDLDLVTVEGRFDVSGLYANFHESFAGKSVKEEWRDPSLAQPVFAAVELQRQDQFSDGSWSDWQTVPRAEIDRNKKMLEVIEDVEQLPPGGIKVRMLQFNVPAVKADLLQPGSYQFASAEDEWYPPSLHKEYVKSQLEAKAQEKREAKETEEKDIQKERDDKRESGKSQKTKSSSDASNMMKMMQMMGGVGPGGPGGGMTTKSTSAASKKSLSVRKSDPAARKKAKEDREKEKEESRAKSKESSKSTKDIDTRFNDLLITEKTKLADMNEPLVFWAYDDTVRPGGTYKYRIRLGVFNPIAGTNQVGQEDESLNNAVVLWSDFSDETEPVEIPGIMYLFPLEVQEAASTVTIQVVRYVLGYWYSKDFMVSPGEVIGSPAKYAASEEEKDITVPKEINYCTNAVLVDVRGPVKEWTGKTLSEKYYFDMLYSLDDLNIAHLPVKRTYWPLELQVKYDEIAKAEKEPKKPLREWGSKRDISGGRPGGTTAPGDMLKLFQLMGPGGPGMGPGGK